ncbi:hypothetical protein BVY03_01120 [bacterium K02(2017)]|nr:hypothetical protein BVY03_01120 [bacterium K02(2017)]
MRNQLATAPKKVAMDVSELKDEEVLDTILEEFEEDARVNMHYIDVEVVDGSVTLSGRVASEEEKQVIDEVLSETLKIVDYHNRIWIDESLSYEDTDDSNPDLKGLSIDDDEIDDQEYSEEEEDDY